MTEEMLRACADALGIHEVEIDGKKHWSIELRPEPDGTLAETAIFDAEKKSWLPQVSASTGRSPGSPMAHVADPTPHSPRLNQTDYFSGAINQTQARDWAEMLPDTPHNNNFKRLQWSKTPLGDLSTWPVTLRLYVYAILFQPTVGPSFLKYMCQFCQPLFRSIWLRDSIVFDRSIRLNLVILCQGLPLDQTQAHQGTCRQLLLFNGGSSK
jgi:hypothetical protein